MHRAIKKYLRFRVNRKTYQFTCLPFRLATSPREFTKLLRLVIAWLRRQGVKLYVCLDDWLISRTGPEAFRDDHLHTPEARMGYQLWEVQPNTKPGLPVSGNTFQHSTVYSGCQGPVSSSALDEQPHHHSKRSTQVAGHGGVHDNDGASWQVKTPTNPVVGRHNLVPEDRELDRQDHSSSVGSERSGLVDITCSPARSSSRHSGNWSHALHRCVQLGLGSSTRLTLDSGTVVSIFKIVAYKRSGDAGRHKCSEGLPASSEVQGGSLDVRQRSHGCLHQEWGGHLILHSHAADNTLAEVVRSQGIRLVPVHLPGVRRRMHCPGLATLSTPSGHWPWNFCDQFFTSGVSSR